MEYDFFLMRKIKSADAQANLPYPHPLPRDRVKRVDQLITSTWIISREREKEVNLQEIN